MAGRATCDFHPSLPVHTIPAEDHNSEHVEGFFIDCPQTRDCRVCLVVVQMYSGADETGRPGVSLNFCDGRRVPKNLRRLVLTR
ncbi:hypothetical protein OUZ56_030203 [Daphnia magna]|uniref:Uncharacterized protein n=1 Tax=Daphnia magna TaxID=35525 RepID=A0ABQ9ZQL2_9CRUS|nr:hypothetical protein OUZ56_030203 [Daphnia magna]